MVQQQQLQSIDNDNYREVFKQQFECYEYLLFKDPDNNDKLKLKKKYNRVSGFKEFPRMIRSINADIRTRAIYCSHRFYHDTSKYRKKINLWFLQLLQFDLDVHTIEQLNQMISDIGCDQYNLLLRLMNDPFIWCGGLTKNHGLRFFIPVFHQNYSLKQIFNESEVPDKDEVIKCCYNEVLNYLNRTYNIKIWETTDKSKKELYKLKQYVDLSSRDNITLPSYQIWDDEYFFDNSNKFKIFYCKNTIEPAETEILSYENNNNMVYDNKSFVEESCDYIQLINYIERNEYNIQDILQPHFFHFNDFSLQCSASYEGDNAIRFIFECYKMFNKGDSIRHFLSSYNLFRDKILANKSYSKFYPKTFAKLLLDWGLKTPAQKRYIKSVTNPDVDSFGNRFDKIFTIKSNIYDEIKDELSEIITDKSKQFKYIIINGDTGSGKNYFFGRYIINNKLMNRNNHLFSPVNSILIQLATDKDIGDQFIRGFSMSETIKSNYKAGYTECAVLSSYQHTKFELSPINIAVYDECHKLVHYSKLPNQDKPFAIVPADVTILMSATPEEFLVGLNKDDYYYIKIRKENYRKPDLDYRFCKKPLDNMIFAANVNRKQLFFINDKIIAKEFSILLFEKYHKKSVVLSADTKFSDEFQDILKEQKLIGDWYIVTESVNDGVNFNNDYWDDIFVYDNGFLTYLMVYQLYNRFRNVKNNISLSVFTKKRKPRFIKYQDFINNYGTLNINYNQLIDLWTKTCDNLNNMESMVCDPYIHYDEIYCECGKYHPNTEVIKKKVVDLFHNQLNQYHYILLNYYYQQFFNVNISYDNNNIDFDAITGNKNIKEYQGSFIDNLDKVCACYIFETKKAINEYFDKEFYDNNYNDNNYKTRKKYYIIYAKRCLELKALGLTLSDYKVKEILFKRERDYLAARLSYEIQYNNIPSDKGKFNQLNDKVIEAMEKYYVDLTGYTIRNIKYVDYSWFMENIKSDPFISNLGFMDRKRVYDQYINNSGILKSGSRNINKKKSKYVWRKQKG